MGRTPSQYLFPLPLAKSGLEQGGGLVSLAAPGLRGSLKCKLLTGDQPCGISSNKINTCKALKNTA